MAETNRTKVLRIHGEEVRNAAIARYISEHPAVPEATAAKAVDAILAGMTPTEAKSKYDPDVPIEPVTPGTRYVPPAEPADDESDDSPVLPGTYYRTTPTVDDDEETYGEVVARLSGSASEEMERETYEQRVSRLTEMTPEELTRAILADLDDRGVDVEDPNVRIWASGDLVANAFVNNREQYEAFAQTAIDQFSSPTRSAYFETLEASGLADYRFIDRLGVNTPSELTGGGVQPIPEAAGDYHIDEESGAILYRNGVIVDSVSGQVLYPPRREVAGSRTWFNDARQSWSEERITKWKTRLADLGYLPREATKDTEWNQSFQTALEDYFESKYQNFGRPLMRDEAAGGYGPGGDHIERLGQIRATLEAQVADLYRANFDRDASPDELKLWTQQVVRIGNELQRGPRGLEAGAAAGEAVSRVGGRLYRTPEATFLRDAEEENTRLRDAIEQAVIVTNSLAG